MPAIKRWEPLFDLRTIRDEMNRMFDSFLADWGRWPFSAREGVRTPAVDVYETDDAVVVKAEVPGIPKENLEVTVEEGALTIKGETSSEEEVKEENYYRRERHWGRFERTIPLPEGVEIDAAEAKFENGLLEIRVPKPEAEAKKKTKIEIK